MKTNEFSQTEFAKWFFEQTQSIEHYPFDAFYDCNHIVQRMQQTFKGHKLYETPENNCVEMFYAVSYMGTHIFDVNEENMESIRFIHQNKYDGHKFFILKFYYNYSYHYQQPFAIVTEYSHEEMSAIISV